MRHGRAKQARKTLQFFQRAAGYKSPYSVLVDGTFLVAMLQAKLPLTERLDRLLQHGNKYQLFMTQSSLSELKQLSEAAATAKQGNNNNILAEAHEWAKRHCQILADMPVAPAKLEQVKQHYEQQDYHDNDDDDHDNNNSVGRKHGSKRRRRNKAGTEDLSLAQNDILRLVTDAVTVKDKTTANTKSKEDDKQQQKDDHQNSNQQQQQQHRQLFIVATQDDVVLGLLRYFPIPLVRLARGSVLLLEQPSRIITTIDQRAEQQKWSLSGGKSQNNSNMTRPEQELVDVVNQQQEQEEREQKAAQERRLLAEYGGRRGGSGNNSHKKRKAKAPNPLSCKKKKGSNETEGKRRRRNKQKAD